MSIQLPDTWKWVVGGIQRVNEANGDFWLVWGTLTTTAGARSGVAYFDANISTPRDVDWMAQRCALENFDLPLGGTDLKTYAKPAQVSVQPTTQPVIPITEQPHMANTDTPRPMPMEVETATKTTSSTKGPNEKQTTWRKIAAHSLFTATDMPGQIKAITALIGVTVNSLSDLTLQDLQGALRELELREDGIKVFDAEVDRFFPLMVGDSRERFLENMIGAFTEGHGRNQITGVQWAKIKSELPAAIDKEQARLRPQASMLEDEIPEEDDPLNHFMSSGAFATEN